MNMHTKFEIRSFARSWDNWEYPKNWAVPGYMHAPFSPNFLMCFNALIVFVGIDPANVLAKFEVRSFTSPWDNSDWNVGWGLQTPNLGE